MSHYIRVRRVFVYLFFLFFVLYGHVHDHKEAFVFKLCSR